MLGKSIGVVKKANGEASSLEWANTVTLDGVSAVQMPFGPMDVQAYKSDGVNLLISLNSGDVVTIENFFSTFAEDEESSELVLQDEEGILWRGQFDPVTSEFDFAEIVTLEAGVGSEAASGALLDLPDWAMLGLAVLAVGGGAIAVHNSRSSSSSKDFIPNAPQAPDAPTDIKITGTLITGKTQPGFTVQVTDADGKLLGKEVIADENGEFQYGILPGELPAEGGSFFVTVVNPAGVSSESTEVVYQPTPDDKELDVGFGEGSDGSIITGNVEPGSTITATVDGKEVGSATADEQGDFEITLNPPLVKGETVTIVVTSPEGDVIQGGGLEAPDNTPPEKAKDVEFDEAGTIVTGTAEPGSTVQVSPTGESAEVDANGDFELTLDAPLTNGEKITITVTDAKGNTSEQVTVTAPDTTAPEAPTDLVVSDGGLSITGKAEAGSTVVVRVTVTDAGGNTQIADGTVDAEGNFSIDLQTPLTNGETVTVTATDAAGNTSKPATAIAKDTTPPDAASALVVSEGGTTLTGKGEPGAKVTVTTGLDDGKTSVAIGVVAADGTFAVTLEPRQVKGEKLEVILTDAASNSSLPSSVTAPTTDAPDAAKEVKITDDGKLVTGKAEIGTTVTAQDTNGNKIVSDDVNSEDGSFELKLDSPLTNGETIVIVVTKDGKESDKVTVEAPDTTSPKAPTEVELSDDGSTVTGKGEPGATVKVTVGTDQEIGIAIVDEDGDFKVTLSPALTDGTAAQVTVTDAAGNTSEVVNITGSLDTQAPEAPTDVKFSGDGTVITGTAEAGSTVIVVNSKGVKLGEAIADAEGNFKLTLDPALTNGEEIVVTATDSSGNQSEPVTQTAPSILPPDAPTGVEISKDGGTVTGKGKPGTKVIIKDAEGNELTLKEGTDTVDGEGNFSVMLESARIDGAKLEVSLTDGTKTSASAQVTAPILNSEYAGNIVEDSVMLTINNKETKLDLADKTDTVGGLLFLGKLVGEGQEFTVNKNHTVSGTVIMSTPGGFNVIGGDNVSIQKQNASGGWDTVMVSSTGNIVQTGDRIVLDVKDLGPGEYRVRSFSMGVLGGSKVIFEADLVETDLATVGKVEFADPSEGSDGARTNNLLTKADAEPGAVVNKINGYDIAQGKYEVSGDYGQLIMRSNGDYEYRPNSSAKGIGKQDQFTYDILNTDKTVTKGTIVIEVGSEQFANAIIEANDDAIDATLSYQVVTDKVATAVLPETVVTGTNGNRAFSKEIKYTVDEHKVSELTVSLSHLSGKSYTVTVFGKDGTQVAQQSGSLPVGYRDVKFDGLKSGDYDVKIEVTGALNATNLRIKTSEIITHLDRYELVENPDSSTGNLLADDVKGSDFTAFEIKNANGDFVNIYSLPSKEITIKGEYGSLTVDFEGNYTYTPNENTSYTGQDLQDNFEYKLIAVNGDESSATITVNIDVAGPEYIETPTGFSMASLSADEGFDFSAVEDTEEFDMFADEPAELELSLEDVLDFEADEEQLSFFAEEDDSALAPESFGQAAYEAALDVTPLVDPLDDVFEQNHSVI